MVLPIILFILCRVAENARLSVTRMGAANDNWQHRCERLFLRIGTALGRQRYVPLKTSTHRVPPNQFNLPPSECRSQLSSPLPARQTGRALKLPGSQILSRSDGTSSFTPGLIYRRIISWVRGIVTKQGLKLDVTRGKEIVR